MTGSMKTFRTDGRMDGLTDGNDYKRPNSGFNNNVQEVSKIILTALLSNIRLNKVINNEIMGKEGLFRMLTDVKLRNKFTKSVTFFN